MRSSSEPPLKVRLATWRPPPRPTWVEDLNTVGRNVGGAALLVPIEADSLIDAARRAAGLADLGSDTWQEPFGVLLAAIEREAELNTIGRLVTRSELLRLLRNRLKIVDTVRRHPEIREQAIQQPIFITGTARSGTSILHELLALDPRNRSPQAWEVLYSVPAPETASYATDPRIADADREVTLWHEIVPEYVTMHVNGGALPHECIFLMSHEFASDHFSGVMQVPSYSRWLATRDLSPAFRFHRLMLQLLQWRCRGERWLLKAPSHLSVLPSLFSVYPDARVVMTHRDPLRTVPSTVSLMATLRHMRRDDVDVDSLAQQMASGMAMGLERMSAQRSRGEIPDRQFVDVRYADLMRDPIGTIERLYEALGIGLDAELRARMRAYLKAKPRGSHGAHRYSAEDFGLDPTRLRERYRPYTERFAIQPERP